MKQFKNILFVSQGLAGKSDSLEQAMRLAKENDARLSGLIVCPAMPSTMSEYQQSYENSLVDNLFSDIKTTQLKDLSSSTVEPFPINVISGDKPGLSIIHEVSLHHYDLVIKDAEPINEESKGFKALDMTLLRKCPCPVWLNRKPKESTTTKRIGVAIDPIIDNEEEKELTTRLLQVASYIANSFERQLHIVSCWDYQMESYLRHHIWIQIEDDVLDQQINTHRTAHLEALYAVIEASGIEGDSVIHHLHGSADEEIPKWVKDEEVDVLVMGTIARGGIQGLVIGNTAENVLQSIDCSLVALKPKGFISPVE
ncbi:universal stress protein [Vibrio campbellii]|uniref:universal stress protein n=1 Tax=Vibrio campbellii TaxID=680 RepID=UPI0005EDCC82|nr:universal stress protein [Vibrio campbellii]OPH50252.1 universal stress protein [Vibrio campbellii]OQQ03904.1 universal stress protein [Vibrio campbellii]